MSIFNEINAEANAKHLEKILIEAIGQGGKVKEFAKKHLYEWYLNECGETWGLYKLNSEIVKAFPPKESESDKPSLIGHKGTEKQNDGFVSNAIPLRKKAEHFINAFGEHSLTVIKICRKKGYEFFGDNAELFNEVEKILNK
jgi:hypothetical protein